MSPGLDLHGYTVSEAVDLFVSFYNGRVDSGDLSQIKVIHGYGSGGTGGKIRTALRKFLSSFKDELQTRTDPVNPGITIVVPLRRLPDGAGILSGEILLFCAGGKTESKILGKFRRFGDLRVKRTLQKLVSQGRMRVSRRGRHLVYTTV